MLGTFRITLGGRATQIDNNQFMNKRNKNKNHGWLDRVNDLLPMVNIMHLLPPDQNLHKFYTLVESMLENNGEKWTIERLKSFRLALQQYCLRQPVTPISFCKTDSDGFPVAIKYLKPRRDDVHGIRYSFSVMRIIETFRCKPEYSISTITDFSSADQNLVEEIKEFISNWEVLKDKPELQPSKYVLSNRAGPNGPATITAIEDLTALRSDPELYQPVMELLGAFHPELREMVDMYPSHEGEFKHSKLVLLSDKACKTRVIAIADWWTNVSLESLHRAFMKMLSNLPSDVTYRQSEIPKLVKGLGKSLYSSDMTAFTDRFPIELEVSLMAAAYGEPLSKVWKQVLTGRKFHHPKGDVTYNCGNPMGLLSSWPVSTLTHHAVKQWCAYKLGIKKYKYLILGDDTLDTNKLVYEKYIDTINKLGVSISPSKSTSSELGNTEFAKRLFINHVEVTGIPIQLLADARRKPEQFLELLRICRERGYEDSILGPSLSLVLSSCKHEKMVLDMLSLPESITGMPPLLEAKPGSWAHILCEFPEESLKEMLLIARNKIFWDTATQSNKLSVSKKVYRLAVDAYHPLSFALSGKLGNYQTMNFADEYSIYNAWMDGNMRELANLPSLDVYRTKNRGHKATKSKYEVLHCLLEIAGGNCNIPLFKPTKLSDDELFMMALENTRKDYSIHQAPQLD